MRLAFGIAVVCVLATHCFAQDNPPVAVRWWGQGMVSIETWWNLTIVIDPYGEKIGYDVPDLVLVTHEHGDHNNVGAVHGDPLVVRGLAADGKVCEINHYLDRFDNSANVEWWPNTKTNSAKRTPHSIFMRSIPAWHDDSQGNKRGATAMFQIVVDGVTILHCGDLGQVKLTDEQLTYLQHVDVLVLPTGDETELGSTSATRIAQQVKPRYIVPINHKYHESREMPMGIDAMWRVSQRDHNTLAVSKGERTGLGSTVVLLSPKPYEPTAELATLLDQMDAASQASQEVFEPLTAEQLNWRPPNGTHTARWNAEHMLGRQLGFFSQIYATIEPDAFSRIDLNPKQMPDDYTPAHPDWDGAEQARQMERANAYVRRFAYLLDGVDLDEPAPGSRWTPRGLLQQMDRHFAEHTANVEKKFDLVGWPEK